MAKITIEIDDRVYTFEASADGPSLLEIANDNGADIPYSCQSGVCCTCMGKVTNGKVEMKSNMALDDDEIEEGYVLLCQARPTTDEVVITYED